MHACAGRGVKFNTTANIAKVKDINGMLTLRYSIYLCSVSPVYCRKHVVFGHVVAGKEYVTAVENQKVDVNHRPYADVRIKNCGELVLMKR